MSTKAQQSLADAFNELVLERPYDDIHIADIIKRADVSRSTFYEHFRNKEQILCNSLTAVLKPIAEAVVDSGQLNFMTPILTHFVEVKELALAYFHSPLSRVMVDLLAQLIATELSDGGLPEGLRIPLSLLCVQLAQSNLGLIEAWLNSEPRIAAEEIALQMINSSRALIGASC